MICSRRHSSLKVKNMPHLVAVDSRKISVVIQGPLYRNLSPQRNIFACIASVRTHLPHAEVIVSTWCHEDTSAVEADQLIMSDDPGAFVDDAGNQININRMLRSTLCGIQAASRPYVMKMRADHNLTSPALAVIGQSDDAEPGETKLFETPITTTTLYIRDPERLPMLFHISDLVQFGTRDAMLAMWEQPLFERSALFNDKPSRNPFGNFIGYTSARLVTEQALMLGVMRRKGIDARLGRPCEVGLSNLKLWDNVLRRNFRVLNHSEAGVDFPERFLTSRRVLSTLYKASAIEQLRGIDPKRYRLRIARIWLNQYLLTCLRPGWWVSFATIVLFSSSPTFAKRVRSYWRTLRKVAHAESYRV
ncbi:WavE lipopolysaccharide synthesis superfamily [Pseudomonas ficuserectae]|nr:WavE lipopolysaccharide synthesis superfamily [Pseudomonas amygdali pv. sesami]RMS35106.1 WavE lipopolysaccharide synthesis superfamily [Pseudomonas ficuserectae]RMV89247.1 WavE lipopolysaccharide synthesis superfamily [Pseudomonas amygdali pv. sesami]